jgi:hypothetical protein
MKTSTLTLMISILLTLLLWVCLDLYHAYNETFLPTVSREIIEDINPNIDLSAVKLLKKR